MPPIFFLEGEADSTAVLSSAGDIAGIYVDSSAEESETDLGTGPQTGYPPLEDSPNSIFC